MVRLPFSLLNRTGASRQTLLVFTLLSATINGLVTASVGAWLAQKYSAAQARRTSINSLSTLLYERRIKAGLVVSSLRRNAELDEIRHRKRGYDEAYVDWNKNLRQNLFAIREVMGEREFSALEQDFEKYVVDPLSRIDACLTRAYDQKMAAQDPLPQLEGCRMAELYQLTLDCGASFTNELYKLSAVRLMPFAGANDIDRRAARARIAIACERTK